MRLSAGTHARGTARHRPVSPVPATLLAVLVSAALTGCTGGDDPTASTPTGAAIDACLAAAATQNDYPVEDAAALEVTTERDDQGWWAVRATAPDGAGETLLTCTAVPDDSPRGVRAASWSVSSGVGG